MLPMLGCTGIYDENSEAKPDQDYETPGAFPTGDLKKEHHLPAGPRSIYLHGHAASRLFSNKDDRIPVTIGISSMQGIVLSLAPFHNSCNYTSAVVHGYASLVPDEGERLYALTRITDNLVPERWDNSRNPPTKAELTSTGVLKVEIESASAKIRVGGPSDDRMDLKDEELMKRVWTGVVPTYTVMGEPVASSYNQTTRLPGYLRSFVDEGNEIAKNTAVAAVAQVGAKK